MKELNSIYQNTKNYLSGWTTKRKIVVIESDDWGSVRMPSREIYFKALKKGIRVDLIPYEKFDALLSEKDLVELFNLLDNFKDINNNPPKITANCLVANPDFERIRNANYEQYFNEPITETFNKYSNHHNCLSLWNFGMSKGFLQFQYHGMEHLNRSLLMSELKNNCLDIKWAIDNHCNGVVRKTDSGKWSNYFVEATKFASQEDLNHKVQIYLDGLPIFESMFGFKSKTVIPTNYIWDTNSNNKLFDHGIIGLQGIKKMFNPLNPSQSRDLRFTGKKDGSGLIDLVRNISLEYSLSISKADVQNKAIRDMQLAFLMKKPAIISMHRINFSGHIFEENRISNLILFAEFLKKIQKKWPDIEFLSSDQLLNEIINDSNS